VAGNDEERDAMADETEPSATGKKGGRGGRRKLPLILVAGILSVALGGGAAAYAFGLLRPGHGAAAEAPAAFTSTSGHGAPAEGGAHDAVRHAAPVFVDLPDILVNLKGSPQRPRFLKLRVSL
jgi:flagellar basal body-associated protein FliL